MKFKYLQPAGEAILAFAFIFIIGYLNFLAIRYFFLGEFNQNIASIEISYVQMAKFWAEGGSLWQPLWYFGYPWHVFYTPVLPFLELAANRLFDFSFAHAYRVITAGAYILVPVSLFLFVWQISKSKTGAFIAGLCYTLLPSVIALLFKGVAADTLSGNLEPRRFAILVKWGEGPHTLGLVFLPIFALFLFRYFEKKNLLNLILASLFLGLCALTNAIVLWAAILLFAAFFLSEIVGGLDKIIPGVKQAIAVLVLTFGFISFWYNIPFLSTFFREGGSSLNNWLSLFPWTFIPIAIVAFIVVVGVGKISKGNRQISFSIFWFLMLFGIIYVYYASGDERIELVPQALRLTTEVDMALGVLAGTLFSTLFLFLWRLKKVFFVTKVIALTSFVILCAVLILPNLQLVKTLGEFTKPRPEGDIQKQAEYRVSKKLEEMMQGNNGRVLVPGNYSFWLNYFTNVPQLRGALYQSSTNFWLDHIYYQIANGNSSQIALAWLKIANISKLVFTGPESLETYKDYKTGQGKFDAVLEKISEENGDVFYNVPLKNSTPVKVIDTQSYSKLQKPYNAIDEQKIFSYVSWLEMKSDKKLDVKRLSNSKWQVNGSLDAGEGILLQETYDSGWQIKDKTAGWKKLRDPMDFMVFVPNKSGDVNLEIVYRKPLTVYLGYLISGLTLIGMAIFFFRSKHKQEDLLKNK